jgi:LysM repeat protein
VVAAYEDADRRLNAKIAQVDPALASYAATRSHGGGMPVPKAAPHVAKATPVARATPVAKGSTHTVAKGETLGGIAGHYGVTVAGLKAANHIQDERKLQAGQVLTIPGAKKVAPAPKSKGWWDKLTS